MEPIKVKKPRSVAPKARKPDQTELVMELITLVRDQMKGQNAILEAAMDAQRASADVLAKWMGMFTPQTTPLKGSSADERALMREQAQAESEWEEIIPTMHDLLSDQGPF